MKPAEIVEKLSNDQEFIDFLKEFIEKYETIGAGKKYSSDHCNYEIRYVEGLSDSSTPCRVRDEDEGPRYVELSRSKIIDEFKFNQCQVMFLLVQCFSLGFIDQDEFDKTNGGAIVADNIAFDILEKIDMSPDVISIAHLFGAFRNKKEEYKRVAHVEERYEAARKKILAIHKKRRHK